MVKDGFNKNKGFRAFALATSLYGGASIFGPLLLLGGGGYILDKTFQTGHLFLIFGMAIAFIITNVLLYRKAAAVTGEIEKISPRPDPSAEDEIAGEKDAGKK